MISKAYKTCGYCGYNAAEALIAVDNKVEYFCSHCLAEWTEDVPEEYEATTPHKQWMLETYGDE